MATERRFRFTFYVDPPRITRLTACLTDRQGEQSPEAIRDAIGRAAKKLWPRKGRWVPDPVDPYCGVLTIVEGFRVHNATGYEIPYPTRYCADKTRPGTYFLRVKVDRSEREFG